MTLSLIVAMGRNRVIGTDGRMPWRIPADLRFFRARTLGKPVVMGRRTFEAIGKPLPGRPNVVVTRDPEFAASGVTLARDLDAALDAARAEAERLGAGEIMIIGGGQIYAQTLARADRLYLTEIDIALDGDAFFPDHGAVGLWREAWREPHAAEGDLPAFDFVICERERT